MENVLSGMRPTGKLHLGNLYGAVSNWTRLVSEGYNCYFFVADLHALTTGLSKVSEISQNTIEMVRDWLTFGIDPSKSTIFIQSEIPAHSELTLLLSMITPLGWLLRNPTYKEQIENLKDNSINTFGFLGYPVLMSSDILLYDASYVPVGADQLPHLEIARWISRRFNHLFNKNILKEPKPLLAPVSKILGTDGRKMSKSYNNAIYLSDSDEITEKKIKKSYTDPQRKRRDDPGRPEICPIFALHRIFTDKNKTSEISTVCRTADIGCVECKKILISNLNNTLAEYRAKRMEIGKNEILDMLHDGTKNAKIKANETLDRVRTAVFGQSSFFKS